MAKNPIRKKLLNSSMSLVILMFVAILGAIVFLSTKQNQEFLKKTENQIRKGLMAKGRTLIGNNAQALSGMVSDNAFLAIQSLVAKTVQEDDDVVFGIYMTAEEKQAWVYANEENSEGSLDGVVLFEDSTSEFISKTQELGHIERSYESQNVLEFYSPVWVDDEIMGYVRYGISTKSLSEAIDTAQTASKDALYNLLATILSIGILAASLAFIRAKKQAEIFSRPIQDLSIAADRIAGGNYAEQINVKSDDEVGELANSFERMRATVQTYTEHLQELVDEKMRQVRDILDNIDQGLFTVNLDGTINEEYSKSTNQILTVNDVSSLNIYQLFKLDADKINDWNDWVQLIVKRHKKLRWQKILNLAPILELEILDHTETRFIKVDYQPVLTNDGEINRIMVLVHDVTDARRIEQIVAEEKLRHDNEVKTILGLVNNIPESLNDFFKETEDRLALIEKSIENIKLKIALDDNPSNKKSDLENFILHVFRDLHTIKGSAATYGFEQLSALANEAEDLVEQIKSSEEDKQFDIISALASKINDIHSERTQIDNVSKKLHGGDSLTVPILESKIDFIDKLCLKFEKDPISKNNKAIQTLSDACLSLRHLPIVKLCGQFENMVLRTADKLNKQVKFVVTPPDFEVHPAFFKPLNVAVIHILRNAIDHGIESPMLRKKSGKDPIGTIEFKIEKRDYHYIFSIADDGAGIIPDQIAYTAVKKELVEQQEVDAMSDIEKVNLLFLPGLTTKNNVSNISGRGVGMNSVQESLKSIGAIIHIESILGKGTQFIIEIPSNVMRFENESYSQ